MNWMKEYCSCQVCFNAFRSHENSPKMLTCGHSFCHSCLLRIIEDDCVCPSCNGTIGYTSVDQIPINFLVKSISLGLDGKESPKTESTEGHEASCSNVETIQENDEPIQENDGPIQENDGPIQENDGTIQLRKETKAIKKKTIQRDELPYNGHCERHFSPNHFKCMNCDAYVCGTCVIMEHKECNKVLPVMEAMNINKEHKLMKLRTFKSSIEDEKKEVKDELIKLNSGYLNLKLEMETIERQMKTKETIIDKKDELSRQLSSHEDNILKTEFCEDFDKANSKFKYFLQENVFNLTKRSEIAANKLTKKILQENQVFVMKIGGEETKTAKMRLVEDKIIFEEWKNEPIDQDHFVVDFKDLLTSSKTVFDGDSFFQKTQTTHSIPKYGNIILEEDGRIKLESLVPGIVNYLTIDLQSLFVLLGCSTSLPTDAYFEIHNDKDLVGEIVIRTDGTSPRALNFLSLTSGVMSRSYKDTTFVSFDDSYIYGGCINEKGKINSFPAVVDGIADSGIYQTERKTGTVEGHNAEYKSDLSVFGIYKGNIPNLSITAFGNVIEGMNIVNLVQPDNYVKECGFIFNNQ